MRRLLPLPLVFGLLFAPLLSASETAYACSCVESTIEQRVQHADVVAIGTAVSLLEDPETVDTRDGVTEVPDTDAVFLIAEYYKGTGAAEIAVNDPPSGGTCGFIDENSVGQEAVLFLVAGSGEYGTNICAGSNFLFDDEALRATLISSIESVTGPGRPPAPPPPPAAPAPPADEHTEDTPWAIILPLSFAIPLAVLFIPAFVGRRGGH